MTAVDVRLGVSPDLGTPHALFQTEVVGNPLIDQYAPSPDGNRFLLMVPLGDADAPPTLLLNWSALLKK